jgi:hypothetical protein
MAIVINGSGTVTGISVGGLPDGIVDAGTLATNSVDSAELIDGSIDNSHLADDAVDSDEIAAGAIDAAHLASGVGGALVKISQESPSGVSEIVFDSSDITSTYKTYLFVFDGLRVAVDATNFLSQISTDNGSSYINSAMSRVTWQENDTGTSIEDTTDDETGGSIFIARNGIGNNHTNGESLGGTAWMFGSQDTGAHCYLMVRSVFVGNSGQTFQEVLTTVIRDKTAINNVRFFAGSGNLAGGTITLYGLT